MTVEIILALNCLAHRLYPHRPLDILWSHFFFFPLFFTCTFAIEQAAAHVATSPLCVFVRRLSGPRSPSTVLLRAFTTPPLHYMASLNVGNVHCPSTAPPPLKLYCLFAYLLCHAASPGIQYVGFCRTESASFIPCLRALMEITSGPGQVPSGTYTSPPSILKLAPAPSDKSAQNWVGENKNGPFPCFMKTLLIFFFYND